MAGKNVVLFGGSKGGTGKTTVCSNIAVIHHKVLEARGERCVVYDTDKQATLSDWNQLRDSSEHKPHINVVQQLVKAGATLRPTIDYALNEAGYTDVLIDAGGRDNPGLRAAMLCCTKMITPLQVSQGGFKSEVQHLPTCKVRRCQAPPRTITNSSLKTASRLPA